MRAGIIGSRRLTKEQLSYIQDIAKEFVELGWEVSTGCADGADHAAMIGARLADSSQLYVFLPWYSYNSKYREGGGNFITYNPVFHTAWTESVHEYHPAPHNLKQGAFKLHARNYGIIKNTQVVVAMPMSLSDVGGTGQGIRIAKGLGKELFVVCDENERHRLREFLDSIHKEQEEE